MEVLLCICSENTDNVFDCSLSCNDLLVYMQICRVTHHSTHNICKLKLYKKIGYNINVLQQTACFVINPITVHNFAFLFNLHASGSDFRLYGGSDLKTYLLMRW